jgi:transposase
VLHLDRLTAPERRLVVLSLVPDDLWFRRCCGKARHRDVGAALAEAARMERVTGLRFAVYFCDDGCQAFHVGSVR